MTPIEIEKYILEKPNACKTQILRKRYIRYTVCGMLFAGLRENKNDACLTVYGRYAHYEETYAHRIFSAQGYAIPKYTDIRLSCDSVPNHVLKSMIDYAYKLRMEEIALPQSKDADGSAIPYCGVLSGYDCSKPYNNDAINESAATMHSNKYDYDDAWERLPYSVLTDIHNEKTVKQAVKLLKSKVKSPKKRI